MNEHVDSIVELYLSIIVNLMMHVLNSLIYVIIRFSKIDYNRLW